MPFSKILIVSATEFEIAPLRAHLAARITKKGKNTYKSTSQEIEFLITGIGMTNTAYQMGKHRKLKSFDIAINLGVAGALKTSFGLTEVVQVICEQFGDLGVEEANGAYTSFWKMGLLDTQSYNEYGLLVAENCAHIPNIRKAAGITVNKVHGYEPNIEAFKSQYPAADTESMEGAAFFQIAMQECQSFAQIRAISNYVEPRNRANWKMKEAIEALSEWVIGNIVVPV
jgi:futalosine hydrolase